jgi:hypothetical protein
MTENKPTAIILDITSYRELYNDKTTYVEVTEQVILDNYPHSTNEGYKASFAEVEFFANLYNLKPGWPISLCPARLSSRYEVVKGEGDKWFVISNRVDYPLLVNAPTLGAAAALVNVKPDSSILLKPIIRYVDYREIIKSQEENN